MLKLVVAAEILKSSAVSSFKSMVKDESGATAIEYGMIVALISVGIIVAVTTIGTKLSTAFTSIANQI